MPSQRYYRERARTLLAWSKATQDKAYAAQLRLRVVDNMRVNSQTIMPSYYKVAGLERVASAFRGRPILTAPQVEDVVVYLGTLR